MNGAAKPIAEFGGATELSLGVIGLLAVFGRVRAARWMGPLIEQRVLSNRVSTTA